ncbi:cupin domain-containing protein [Nitrogeniibacter aestuarii]|uniref:cupin domain-containing protein n=1 Tax=Nitrogeniibacter aestuarii TaxID=2815343 RepID=UPI001D0F9742|nr:cupin domain-containing protein [Nitrogeniibacter aestuarii]
MTPPASDSLLKVFAVLSPALTVSPVPVTPDVYQRLDADFDSFRGHVLISAFEFSAPWPTWERHPAGDETVILLEGDVTLTLRTAAGDEHVRLSAPGQFLIVPRNTWHTAVPHRPTRMIFITPGEGTENSSSPTV